MSGLRTRIIPALLLRNESLVKTVRFRHFTYVGDPCNTVRIFNELEVDELVLLDITATREGRSPNISLIADIASECFMPLAYGGGIASLDQAKEIFDAGVEKVAINTATMEKPHLLSSLAAHYGSQAVIASIDVKKRKWRRRTVWTRDGRYNTHVDPVEWAQEMQDRGAGEILLTSIDREGTWSGFDVDLIRSIADAVSIPVIAHGGAGSIRDICDAVVRGGASAVALGSLVVFQKKGMGVLVNFPDGRDIYSALESAICGAEVVEAYG